MSIDAVRSDLKAPFPYFGGKRRVAQIVWDCFGDVANYIEPFCGSAAMLLCRPTPGRIETINDVDCYVANFWRATQHDPESVAYHADGPVNEADLHARHRWLVLSRESEEFRQQIRRDPEYFDARIAGWWCWGLCCWIGGGWCTHHGETSDGDRKECMPEARQGGRVVNGKPRSKFVEGGTADGDREERSPHLTGQVVVNKTPKDGQLPDLSGSRGAAGRGVAASAGHKKRPKLGDGRGTGGESGANRTPERKPNASGNGHSAGVHSKRPLLGARSERDINAGVNTINQENTPYLHDDKKPLLNAGGNAVETPGRGIHGINEENKRPQLGDAYSRGRGVNANDHAGTCEQRLRWLLNWFGELRDRLRTVRVCCGHWNRVCNSPSVTTRLGVTGVFFDPPYPTHAADGSASRDGSLYASDQAGSDELDNIRDEVLAYCLERGRDPLMRIAVCGYDTDGYAELEQHGWSVVAWKAQGGYGNRSKAGKANSERERIWFSPACVDPSKGQHPLFPD